MILLSLQEKTANIILQTYSMQRWFTSMTFDRQLPLPSSRMDLDALIDLSLLIRI